MAISIIHLSDLHYIKNWEEDVFTVLDAFFEDLNKQIKQSKCKNFYLVFSGDLVYEGRDSTLYDEFIERFDVELNKVNIPKAKRICVPGNHDISIDEVKKVSTEHESVISKFLSEKEFNDYITNNPPLFTNKFENYRNFQSKFCDFGLNSDNISGAGWTIEDNIGIYCMNSAIFSSGNFENIKDKNRLCIDTRTLQKWLSQNETKIKLLILHHPLSWLTDWSDKELNKIIQNKFSLVLSGHTHDQKLFYSIQNGSKILECTAPPLLTSKDGNLGYSIINISELGLDCLLYRQWTNANRFVTGVSFSNTDDGKVKLLDEESNCFQSSDFTKITFSQRLNKALKSFPAQPIIWIDPILSKTNEIPINPSDKIDDKVHLSEFISNPKSTLIKAPPQYGLTCLAHYMVKEAWEKHSSFWLYLDCKNNLKPHKLDKTIKGELEGFEIDRNSIDCLIIDSWNDYDADSFKLLKSLCDFFKEKPIVVMHSIEDSKFLTDRNTVKIERNFEVFYLLALPRRKIRKIVKMYNENNYITDEDSLMNKVVTDLDVLNIPRTPLNILTLLTVSEKYFDESPVNRTKLLELVLFLLFNIDGIPTYKSKPDVKDCEYVLGRYCEKMIRENINYFSREDFIKDLTSFCEDKLLDLEIDLVFDIFYTNNIIVDSAHLYRFRFTYWIFYFAANRMHHDQNFTDYIFEEKRYASFPEIIEFYTGIDRRRIDALELLKNDLKETCDQVQFKVGLPEDMNPYRLINWNPTDENLEKMQNEITENVLNSNLPASVKDQHADMSYNQRRPYYQTIQKIFKEYSVIILQQSIKAASRALRNSDYVDPKIKRELISEILRSWEQLSKVLFAITPLLALRGSAVIDGAGFLLMGNFGESQEDRIKNILTVIPCNIVSWFKEDGSILNEE